MNLDDLLPIARDLTASLTAEDRSNRLVDVVHGALPCDATVLLRLDGDELVPVAAHGLAPDIHGRRFQRGEHPRLDRICRSRSPTIFPADSDLPDPYDGLIEGAPHLDVHSCLGCPLRVESDLVGVLTADALKPGAFDAIDPRFLEHLAALAAAALRTRDLIEALENQARHQGLVARDLMADVLERRGGHLLGNGEALTRLRNEVDLVGRSEFPVLVLGETGVGKEIVARMLHGCSPRADRPLVYVNCAALPESVAESELFGHRRGAFTGAEKERPGKFRVANGASLFLDEIGELPLAIQPKLLRVLQEGEVQSVGEDHPSYVDVRIIAATNRDLEAEVRAGRFRADLLHRLDVCRLRVPPLREHIEDVPLLAGHFADRTRRQLGTGPIRFAPSVPKRLAEVSWPGNVRELANVVQRAILRASARVTSAEVVLVEPFDLGLEATVEPPSSIGSGRLPAILHEGTSFRDAVQDYERGLIRMALRASDGNWATAARSLGMHRSNLHHLAKRLGLR